MSRSTIDKALVLPFCKARLCHFVAERAAMKTIDFPSQRLWLSGKLRECHFYESLDTQKMYFYLEGNLINIVYRINKKMDVSGDLIKGG